MRSTSILTRILNPEQMCESLFQSYKLNPLHIDVAKYCTKDLAAYNKAEESLKSWLGGIVAYELTGAFRLCDCEQHGEQTLIVYGEDEETIDGQLAYIQFVRRPADHTWVIEDVHLVFPGIDGHVESIFDSDTSAETEALRAGYLERLEAEGEEFLNSTAGMSEYSIN